MSDSKSRAQIHEDSKENSKFSHDETKHPAPYEEGQKKSHDLNDSKDERSIANRLAAAEKKKDKSEDTEETKLFKKDPTLPARMHGNEPSKGAKIDKMLEEEDAEMIAKKDKQKKH